MDTLEIFMWTVISLDIAVKSLGVLLFIGFVLMIIEGFNGQK